MMRQTDLGATRLAQLRALAGLRQAGHIGLGGNRRLRIYGRLDCASGQRMQAANRVFFRDVAEAADGSLLVIEDREGGRLLKLTPRK